MSKSNHNHHRSTSRGRGGGSREARRPSNSNNGNNGRNSQDTTFWVRRGISKTPKDGLRDGLISSEDGEVRKQRGGVRPHPNSESNSNNSAQSSNMNMAVQPSSHSGLSVQFSDGSIYREGPQVCNMSASWETTPSINVKQHNTRRYHGWSSDEGSVDNHHCGRTSDRSDYELHTDHAKTTQWSPYSSNGSIHDPFPISEVSNGMRRSRFDRTLPLPYSRLGMRAQSLREVLSQRLAERSRPEVPLDADTEPLADTLEGDLESVIERTVRREVLQVDRKLDLVMEMLDHVRTGLFTAPSPTTTADAATQSTPLPYTPEVDVSNSDTKSRDNLPSAPAKSQVCILSSGGMYPLVLERLLPVQQAIERKNKKVEETKKAAEQYVDGHGRPTASSAIAASTTITTSRSTICLPALSSSSSTLSSTTSVHSESISPLPIKRLRLPSELSGTQKKLRRDLPMTNNDHRDSVNHDNDYDYEDTEPTPNISPRRNSSRFQEDDPMIVDLTISTDRSTTVDLSAHVL